MSTKHGTLFVVATPIGNLDDISRRACQVLVRAAVIAAEDTRHSARLLDHLGIRTPLMAYHDHNERAVVGDLIERLLRGDDVALISDAGTPLLSDPGYRLVRLAHDHGIEVVSIPGPSAITAALSICGVPVNRFAFEGYLPEKTAARRSLLHTLAREQRTLVFFEAPHRILAAVDDCISEFGAERQAALCRELTKKFENARRGTLGELRQWLQEMPERTRGEFVIVIEGTVAAPGPDEQELRRMLGILLAQLSLKDAAAVAAELTGRSKNELYALALALRQSTE